MCASCLTTYCLLAKSVVQPLLSVQMMSFQLLHLCIVYATCRHIVRPGLQPCRPFADAAAADTSCGPWAIDRVMMDVQHRSALCRQQAGIPDLCQSP